MSEPRVGSKGLRLAVRSVSLPVAFAVCGYYMAPKIVERVFAPPRRESTLTPADLGLPEEEVWLEGVGGKRLHGWLVPVKGHAPVVIVLHGWGGNAALMLPLASHLHQAGFHSLFLDARNHGLSEHDRFTSMPRFAEDLEVAVDWARTRSEVTSVGVIGHSVGAGAAIYSSSRGVAVEAVVSVSAPSDPGDMMRQQLASIPTPILEFTLRTVQRVIGYRFEEFSPRHRIGLVNAPVMLVHGAADHVVPIDNLYELAEANPAVETLVVADGGHSDLAPFENNLGEVIDFLDRHLRS